MLSLSQYSAAGHQPAALPGGQSTGAWRDGSDAFDADA
jgi:hypothetical protein